MLTLLRVLAERAYGEGAWSVSFTNLFWLAYFIGCHARGGQTVGKRIIGIRVVNMDPEASQDKIPFARVLVRETIGRVISLLTLWGYARIFFNPDRLGWHDKAGATRVVTTIAGQSSPMRTGLVIASVFAVGVGLAAFQWYRVEYTSMVVKELAKALELDGFIVDGVEGNRKKGYTIERIAKETAEGSMEIRGLHFNFTERTLDGVQQFIVRSLTIDSATFVSKKAPDASIAGGLLGGVAALGASGVGKPKREVARPAETPPEAGAKSERATKRIIEKRDLLIEHIDVLNVKITVPGKPTYELKRLFVSDLEYKAATLTMNLGRFYVESDHLDVNVEKFLAQSGDSRKIMLSLGKPAYVKIKPALFPEHLRKPVDLQIEGFYDGGTESRLSVSGFGKRLQISYSGGTGDFQVLGITPLHYFKTQAPIWDLQFKAWGDMKNPAGAQVQGSIALRGKVFKFDQRAQFEFERAGRKFTLIPLLPNFSRFLAGQGEIFLMRPPDGMSLQDALADIYFEKPHAQLSEQEKLVVAGDRQFFQSLEIPNFRQMIELSSQQRPPSRLPPKMPPQRLPTSLQGPGRGLPR